MTCKESRAGYLGFVVLQCSSKSHFQANLTIEIAYFLAGPIKITYPSQIQLLEHAKNSNFLSSLRRVGIFSRMLQSWSYRNPAPRRPNMYMCMYLYVYAYSIETQSWAVAVIRVNFCIVIWHINITNIQYNIIKYEHLN